MYVSCAPCVPVLSAALQECIADSGDRMGVSRPTIKKYIEDKYGMEVTASVISNINRSIAYGAEKGTFVLPKGACLCRWPALSLTLFPGPSGKVRHRRSVVACRAYYPAGQTRPQESVL